MNKVNPLKQYLEEKVEYFLISSIWIKFKFKNGYFKERQIQFKTEQPRIIEIYL